MTVTRIFPASADVCLKVVGELLIVPELGESVPLGLPVAVVIAVADQVVALVELKLIG